MEARDGDGSTRATPGRWSAPRGVPRLRQPLRHRRPLGRYLRPGGLRSLPAGGPAVAPADVPGVGPGGVLPADAPAAPAARPAPAAADAATRLQRPGPESGRH